MQIQTLSFTQQQNIVSDIKRILKFYSQKQKAKVIICVVQVDHYVQFHHYWTFNTIEADLDSFPH